MEMESLPDSAEDIGDGSMEQDWAGKSPTTQDVDFDNNKAGKKRD
jgi:hypothetical protein